MEKREDIWRSTLKEQFDHFEAETERDLWPAIQEQIDTRRVPFYLWRSTWLVAASIVVLLGLMWMLRQPDPAQQAPLAETEQQSTQPSESTPDHESIAPDPEYADADLLPTAPDPELIRELDVQRHEELHQEPENKGEMAVESSLPPNRIIRQVGPMQPLTPENIRNQMDRPQPVQSLANAEPEPENTLSEDPVDVDPEPVIPTVAPVTPAPARVARGERQTIDLNDITLGDALTFASNELGKLVRSPVEVTSTETENQEVRTFELDLFNLRVTRKIQK